MSSNKPKRVNYKFLLILAVTFLIIISLAFIVIDKFANEDRDYALNKEMFSLVHELDGYKKQHGVYPQSISEIRNTDNLCVNYIYQKCHKVHYNPIDNKQDFRLALHSFTWVVLWYRPGACVDIDNHQLTSKESEQLQKKYGTYYYFCAAAPEGSKPTPNASFPIYREDKKIFDNPKEWPVL
jgi:hypothetical protein